MDTTAIPSRTASMAKALIIVLVSALLAGALYLIAVRGEILMIDLAKIGQALCL